MNPPPPRPADLSDATRRSLRLWAIADAIGGLVLAYLAIALIPWKSPGINIALLLYAALHLVAGHGLWRGWRLGWRLSVFGGLVGFVLGVVLVSALIGSWAYLHAIFGDFGRGASIAALLFASVAVQALGLYPALKLYGLLRARVREEMAGGRGWLKAVMGLSALPLLVGLALHVRHDIDPLDPVSSVGRQQAIGCVRAALDGSTRPPLDALEGLEVGPGPLYATLWVDGRVRARVTGEGDDLAAAVARAADAMAAHPAVVGRAGIGGRIKIDRVVGAAPVLSDFGPIVALSVNPGLDGLRRVSGESRRTLLPDDLVKGQRFGLAPLVPGIRELRLGLDAGSVLGRLGRSGDLERIRTEGWIEAADRVEVLPAVRGNVPPVDTGPDAWRRAAVDGGDFVLRQIRPDNRFHYQYFPLTDHHPKGDAYSVPRHAGTVYALALLYGLTGEARFRAGAEKAMSWLIEAMPAECGDPSRTCVPKARGDFADLGSSALTLVGMLEYQLRTDDARYADTARRLAAWIRSMQKPNGDFYHDFHVPTAVPNIYKRSMFYSEEAALALVMAHEVLGDARDLEAAERALDYLTGPKYAGYFLGWFIYGADHWTCIAAEEAYPRLRKSQYLDFCMGYAEFVRRLQYEPEGWDNADFAGHYGFSGLMVPQAPGAAGFSEAIVSTRALARQHGLGDGALDTLDAQIAGALDALSRERIRPDNAWMMPDPAAAAGGIRRSLVEQEVRIDFTQHALSALIRGAEELDPPTAPDRIR